MMMNGSEGLQMERPRLSRVEGRKQDVPSMPRDPSPGPLLSEDGFIEVTSLPGNALAVPSHASPVTHSIHSNFLVALPLSAEFPARDWNRKCNSVLRFGKPSLCTYTDIAPCDMLGHVTGQGPHRPPAPPAPTSHAHPEPGPQPGLATRHHQTSRQPRSPLSFPLHLTPPRRIWKMKMEHPENTAEGVGALP